MQIRPAWLTPSFLRLRTLQGAVAVPPPEQRSWCKIEVKLTGHKAVGAPAQIPNQVARESPPAVVAAIHLVTVLNHKTNANEIAGVSVVLARAVNIDTPMSRDEWNNVNQLRHFSVVRRLDGVSFPPGWDTLVRPRAAPARQGGLRLCLSLRGCERCLKSTGPLGTAPVSLHVTAACVIAAAAAAQERFLSSFKPHHLPVRPPCPYSLSAGPEGERGASRCENLRRTRSLGAGEREGAPLLPARPPPPGAPHLR